MSDLRGFRYALEPVALKAGWDADEALSALAQLNREIDAARAALEALDARLEAVVAALRRAAGARLDPAVIRAASGFQRQLQAARVQAQERLAALEERREASLRILAERENYRSGIEQHRSRVRKEFAHERLLAQVRDTDDMWLQRLLWRQE